MNNRDALQRVDQGVLDRFKELLRGRTDWYGHRDFQSNKCWTEGARGHDGKLLKDEAGNNLPPIPLSDEHFHRHFNKIQGLGIIPIQPNGNVNFGCLDIDKDDIDHIDLVNRIKSLGLPLYVFVSRSRAAHAYFFIGGDGMSAALVQKRLNQWGLALGCGKDLPVVEVFPKQTDLNNKDSIGNYVNIPFFQQFAESVEPDDHRGKFVTSDGRYVGLEEFVTVAEQHDPKMSMPLPIRTVAFSDGPPCLETLQQRGIPEGMRNLGLYNVGVYFKKSDPENWEDLLQAYNNKFMVPPFHGSKMDKREMMQLLKSLRKKEYQYKCKEDPIASHCEAGLCKTRLHGIKTKEEMLRDKVSRIDCPIIGLIKYESDPVTWGLVLNGGSNTINVSGGELLMYQNLRKYILDGLGELPQNMKSDEWDLKLKDLLTTAQKVEVSEESGDTKLILTLLEQFVENGSTNERLIDSMCAVLIRKKVDGQNGSLVCITTKSFREYLLGMKVKFEINRLSVTLKQAGWESATRRIDKGVKRVWSKFYPGLIPRHTSEESKGDTVDEAISRTTTADLPDEEQPDTE